MARVAGKLSTDIGSVRTKRRASSRHVHVKHLWETTSVAGGNVTTAPWCPSWAGPQDHRLVACRFDPSAYPTNLMLTVGSSHPSDNTCGMQI